MKKLKLALLVFFSPIIIALALILLAFIFLLSPFLTIAFIAWQIKEMIVEKAEIKARKEFKIKTHKNYCKLEAIKNEGIKGNNF